MEAGEAMAVQFVDAAESIEKATVAVIAAIKTGNPATVQTMNEIFWNAAQAFYLGANSAADRLAGEERR